VRGLLAKVEQALGRRALVVGYAPGRINVIGEHTDYIGGLALPAAIDRGVCVGLVRAKGASTFQSVDEGGQAERDATGPRVGDPNWLRYVAGALAEFCVARPDVAVPAFHAAVAGDVPRGAGLSSSAALCVAMVRALSAWTRCSLSDAEVVAVARRVEHRWLGVHCGALDQTASQCGRAGHLLRVDFRTAAVTPVPAPLDALAWWVLDTGVRRSLAGSAYSERVATVEQGLAQVRRRHPEVRHWRDLSADQLSGLPVLAARRLRHGITENERVDAMVDALSRRDAPRAGALLDASHASLRDDYGVSCPELDEMAAVARQMDGVYGARMVGAGFGGCVLALVDGTVEDGVPETILDRYARAVGRRGAVHRLAVADGAKSWDRRNGAAGSKMRSW